MLLLIAAGIDRIGARKPGVGSHTVGNRTRQVLTMKTVMIALGLSLATVPVSAQDPPVSGIVLVRVVAKVTAVLNDQLGGTRKVEELPDAVVATGSGFVVSQLGYVVTNHHVVADEEYRGRIGGAAARISLTVQRVEVFFSPDPRSGRPGATLEASIVASDPDLDLAVLAVPGNELDYVPFGDSDALRTGEPVSAVGYPLGEALEVSAEPGNETLVPAMSSGVVSALRADEQGTARYVQTSAPLNRGNSGGPLLDRNGFAVGVVQMKAREAEGIGFAIPINLVKAFLERNGLDSALPATRLTLGHLYDSPEKLVRFQAPGGFEDSAPSRLAVDSGESLDRVALHIDRIASPWTLEQVEQELQSGAFEVQESVRLESSIREGRVLRGQANGRVDGRAVRMIYALVDLRGEKIVARYVGTPEQVAYNSSVLTASLASIEALSMTSDAARQRQRSGFEPVSPGVMSDFITALPAGWVVDPGEPVPCDGLAPARESLVASPRRDFTTSFRIGRYAAAIEPTKGAIQCHGDGETVTGEEYRKRFSRFGVDYRVEGRFLPSGSRTVQVEVVAPTRTFSAAREAFDRWIALLALGPG